ncbi:MAG TPA: GNAT family N-acetyltransferase [Bacteroidales bacterium]|nr:GNAT family N-acetyltransferase [Bacteroidales bacterium]
MITIRESVFNDTSVIADFQQKMAFETEDIYLDNNKVRAGVNAVMEDKSKGFYIVAEEGEIVASMLLTPEWSDWRNGYFLWIQSLYVIPDYRKKGVFRMMYDFVKNKVNSSEAYVGIKLYVDQHNEVAQKAYEKVGMESSHYRMFEWNKK